MVSDGTRGSDSVSINFDVVTCTSDDVAKGAGPPVVEGFGAGGSSFSVDRAGVPLEIVFSGIPAELEALAPTVVDPSGITPVDFDLNGTTGSVSPGMSVETDPLAPTGIDPDGGVVSVDVDFGGTTGSVFSGRAGLVDALASAEVRSGTLGLGSTNCDGSAVFELPEADMVTLIEVDSLLPNLVALFSSSGVDRLETDLVESGTLGRMGVTPLVVAAITSEVPLAELLDVISSGSGLRLLLLVTAVDSLNQLSLDGAPVILVPTERLGDVTPGASSEVAFIIFSSDGDAVLLACADSDSDG